MLRHATSTIAQKSSSRLIIEGSDDAERTEKRRTSEVRAGSVDRQSARPSLLCRVHFSCVCQTPSFQHTA